MRRIPEVLDSCFESGSMPYAQVHYPLENKKHFEEHFPADFICEGLDQTRGWFYTLVILAAGLGRRFGGDRRIHIIDSWVAKDLTRIPCYHKFVCNNGMRG